MSISITQATKAVKAALSAKTLSLFRRMCRESAVVTKIYELPLTPAEVRHLVGLHFRANAGVTEPRIVESLLIKVRAVQGGARLLPFYVSYPLPCGPPHRRSWSWMRP